MSAADTTTAVILLDFAVVVTAAGLATALARRFGQPAVIGEIVAGIALGPSLLGLLPGDPSHWLFPTAERPILGVLGNVGLVLFMFVVGYEVDLGQLRRARSAVATVALGSIALPMAMGTGLALWLYPQYRDSLPEHIGRIPFVLFLGVALSITAFPVLARILTDLKLQRSPIGGFAMSVAAVTDVLAWALLAVVVLLAVGGSWTAVGLRAAGLVLFVVALALVVRPLLRRLLLLLEGRRAGPRTVLLIIVVGLLLSSWATTELGFHPIFGAFAFGAAVPKAALAAVAPETPLLIEQTGWLFMPVFFITTGLGVDIAGIGWVGLGQLALVMLVACAGKFLGSAGAARLTGMPARQASAVGVLMNCRGLTELVVIQAGVSVGVLTPRLATIMIVMAVLTTAMTAPLFGRIHGKAPLPHEAPDATAAQVSAPTRAR
ncbi:cation:proton antiporter [Kitasatospora sp. NPDC092286]|uniref:cation:proton antiporter n=1 Tax=Kitasatospora sp. NPDC092286 TaxID=3364087 RepID=UPI0037F25817